MSVFVRGVQFTDDGIAFDYADPDTDLRLTGLVKNHVLFVPASDPFAEIIDDLIDAVQAALNKSLAEWDKTPAAELVAVFDDDETPSPYDNPEDVLS